MKSKAMVFILMVGLLLTAPAQATDYDFFGNLQYHNDILYWDVTTGGGAVTVFTSSWDEGNFDPMLQVWNQSTGALLYQQDDGGNVGSTSSNGTPYSHGTWDTYYSLDLGAGTYRLSLSTYVNWANGDNWNDPEWSYAGQAAIPILSWNQPANGSRGDYYAVHFLGATSVDPGPGPGQVPEPAAMLLLGLGLVGLAGIRGKIK